ncbi:MAG TPA: sigma-70 family RNA polymerase sigma factor [Bryobacteraceae bacterium]|nr:sigma-70 family RNA polymerase sigma factor [Bryobacteraceae bacterium]
MLVALSSDTLACHPGLLSRAGWRTVEAVRLMAVSSERRSEEFEAAALPHLNDLYRTASRLLSDSTRAEDVVQEAYLQAWKSFDRFESGTNCRAWLFKILFNVLHHYRRKWFSARAVLDSGEPVEEVAAPAPPVPEHITDEEILAALAEVPDDFRSVVLLVDVEEFSYRETAGVLNVPIGTVMSRLSRGRRLLRERLAGVARSYGIRGEKQQGQGA